MEIARTVHDALSSTLVTDQDEFARALPSHSVTTPEEATRAMLRKGFRRRVSGDRAAIIRSKVERAYSGEGPLVLVVPFGGYKHFWNTGAPQVDWAEVYHLEHMISNLLPIARGIPDGIRLEYVSEDFLVAAMDNYPQNHLDCYAESFSRLTKAYDQATDSSLSVSFWRLSDRYETDRIRHELLDMLPDEIEKFHKRPSAEQDIALTRSWRSVMWDGAEDLTGLSMAAMRERVVYARVLEMTFSEFGFTPSRIGGYYEAGLNSCIVFSWGLSPDNAAKQFLTMHSTRGSCVDFWIGRGVLESHGDRLRPTIVSRLQWAESKETQRIELSPSAISPNLSQIDVRLA